MVKDWLVEKYKNAPKDTVTDEYECDMNIDFVTYRLHKMQMFVVHISVCVFHICKIF